VAVAVAAVAHVPVAEVVSALGVQATQPGLSAADPFRT